MFSIGPAIVFLIGVVVMIKFPMTRSEHDDIRKQLDEMRKKGA
jgi:Na+/melibiose symporter-like transporter